MQNGVAPFEVIEKTEITLNFTVYSALHRVFGGKKECLLLNLIGLADNHVHLVITLRGSDLLANSMAWSRSVSGPEAGVGTRDSVGNKKP